MSPLQYLAAGVRIQALEASGDQDPAEHDGGDRESVGCPCCVTSTCAPLTSDFEAQGHGPNLSDLVGLLIGSFPLSLSKVLLLAHHLGMEINSRAFSDMRQQLSTALEVGT